MPPVRRASAGATVVAQLKRPNSAWNAPVQRTGACRRRDRELDPAGVGCLQRASGQIVDAGACEQSGVCQSVAGIAVAEKNRCLRISAPGLWSVAVPHQSSGLAGTISGTKEGTVGGGVSRDLVYTQPSRRGEVAERLKAAVC